MLAGPCHRRLVPLLLALVLAVQLLGLEVQNRRHPVLRGLVFHPGGRHPQFLAEHDIGETGVPRLGDGLPAALPAVFVPQRYLVVVGVVGPSSD